MSTVTTGEKKTFLARQTLQYVLDSDISNEAKVFYARVFAAYVPEYLELPDGWWQPIFRIPYGSCRDILLVATSVNESVVKELLDKQLICRFEGEQINLPSGEFVHDPRVKIVPRDDYTCPISYPNSNNVDELPKELKTSDGLIIFPCNHVL